MTIEEARKRILLVRQLLEGARPLEPLIQELAAITWDFEGEGVQLDQAHLVCMLRRYLSGETSEGDIELWANQVEGREDVQVDASSGLMIEEVLHELANPLLTQPLDRTRAAHLVSKLTRKE